MVPGGTGVKVRCGREFWFQEPRSCPLMTMFFQVHTHTHEWALRHGVFHIAQFFLFLLSSHPVFLPIFNITFSILNKSLSIKYWQPKQGSLECFETALVDEIQKPGNHGCGWKAMGSRDRQTWIKIRLQLFIPYGTLGNLNIQSSSFLHMIHKVPRTVGTPGGSTHKYYCLYLRIILRVFVYARMLTCIVPGAIQNIGDLK